MSLLHRVNRGWFIVSFFSLFIFLTPHLSAQENAIDTAGLSKMGDRVDVFFYDAIKAEMLGEDAKALTQLEAFVKLRPNVSAAYYEMSKLNDKAGKPELAREQIKKAMEMDGTNKWYKEQYASILVEHKEYAEAADILAGLAVTEPNNKEYLLNAAIYYQEDKKYDKALEMLDKLEVQTGGDDEILLQKEELYLKKNDIPNASKIIHQLIDQNPKEGKYYKVLADIYDNNKETKKAEEVYHNAELLLPDDASIELGMANHYQRNGDSVNYIKYARKAIVNSALDAETQFALLVRYIQARSNDSVARTEGLSLASQLIAMHPTNAEGLALYGELLVLNNQRDLAVEQYKKSVAANPSQFQVWQQLLGSYTDKKDADSLVKYSEKAIRLFPNQAVAHYLNGIGKMNQKKYPEAAAAINRAIDMQPEDDTKTLAEMYSLLGDVYNSAKDYAKSDAAFNKALKLIPDDASLLNNYSYYLSERNTRLDDAEKMSKRSLELRPNEATFLDTYGWILYQSGKYEKAKEYIQKAVDANAANADATLYDHLGNVYYKLNDKDKAVEYWQLAKQKGADDPQIDKKIQEKKLYE